MKKTKNRILKVHGASREQINALMRLPSFKSLMIEAESHAAAYPNAMIVVHCLKDDRGIICALRADVEVPE